MVAEEVGAAAGLWPWVGGSSAVVPHCGSQYVLVDGAMASSGLPLWSHWLWVFSAGALVSSLSVVPSAPPEEVCCSAVVA